MTELVARQTVILSCTFAFMYLCVVHLTYVSVVATTTRCSAHSRSQALSPILQKGPHCRTGQSIHRGRGREKGEGEEREKEGEREREGEGEREGKGRGHGNRRFRRWEGDQCRR